MPHVRGTAWMLLCDQCSSSATYVCQCNGADEFTVPLCDGHAKRHKCPSNQIPRHARPYRRDMIHESMAEETLADIRQGIADKWAPGGGKDDGLFAPPEEDEDSEVARAARERVQQAEQEKRAQYMQFRMPLAEDMKFVLRAWMTGFQGHGWSPMCKPNEYFEHQQRLISDLAQSDHVRLIVACDVSNPQQLYGFACGEPVTATTPLVMHWVYIKQVFRRLGVARELMREFGWQPGMQIIATHWTKRLYDGNFAFMRKHRITCNPYILMRGYR